MSKYTENLEKVDKAAAAIPVAEDIHVGGDSAAQIEAEERAEYEQKAGSAASDEKDAEIAKLKLQMEQMQENVAKLMASGRITPEQAADTLDEHEIEATRRKIYDRIKKSGNKVRIVIHSHSDPAQNRPVPIGLNGRHRKLERAKPVVVTAQELEILDHAECNVVEKVVTPDGNTIQVETRRQSYPYVIIDHNIVEAAA